MCQQGRCENWHAEFGRQRNSSFQSPHWVIYRAVSQTTRIRDRSIHTTYAEPDGKVHRPSKSQETHQRPTYQCSYNPSFRSVVVPDSTITTSSGRTLRTRQPPGPHLHTKTKGATASADCGSSGRTATNASYLRQKRQSPQQNRRRTPDHQPSQTRPCHDRQQPRPPLLPAPQTEAPRRSDPRLPGTPAALQKRARRDPAAGPIRRPGRGGHQPRASGRGAECYHMAEAESVEVLIQTPRGPEIPTANGLHRYSLAATSRNTSSNPDQCIEESPQQAKKARSLLRFQQRDSCVKAR